MRTTLPPQQRMPSPNAVPAPPPIVLLPWKNRPLLLITPSAVSDIESFDTLAVPDELSTPPPPVPFAQPSPVPPLFKHGQGVPLPSPKHTGVPGFELPPSLNWKPFTPEKLPATPPESMQISSWLPVTDVVITACVMPSVKPPGH